MDQWSRRAAEACSTCAGAVHGSRARIAGETLTMTGNQSPPGGGAGLRMSLEVLERFEAALGGVLDELVGGDAPLARSTEYTIGAADFGHSFAEAPLVGAAVQETATRLRQLLDVLQDQITAMRLSVKVAGANTGDTDDDTRRTLNEVIARIDRNSATTPPGSAPSGGSAPASPEVKLG